MSPPPVRRRLVLVVVALAVFAATIAQLPAALGLSLHDPDAPIINALVWITVGSLWGWLAWRHAGSVAALWRLPSVLFRAGVAGGATAVVVSRVVALFDADSGPQAVINAIDDGLYGLGVVALVSLAAFASSRSVVRPGLVGARPPVGARDISLRTRIVVATAGASFATAGMLLNVLVEFGLTPPERLVAYLASAAGLVGSAAFIGWLVGEDAAEGVATATRRVRDLAAADGAAHIESLVIAADEVGDLMLATSELERRIRLEEAIAAATTERERIARELHDGVAKSVSVLSLDLASVSARAPDDLRGPLERIEHLAHLLSEELRAIVHEFRARAESEPFERALRRAVRSNATTTVEIAGNVDRVGTLARFEVLRILEEAVRNAQRHSGAHRVTARVSVDDGHLRLAVEDDGRGMRPLHWSDLAAQGHFGILGMRERAALLGGELRVGPAPCGGTSVTLDVPLGPSGP